MKRMTHLRSHPVNRAMLPAMRIAPWSDDDVRRLPPDLPPAAAADADALPLSWAAGGPPPVCSRRVGWVAGAHGR